MTQTQKSQAKNPCVDDINITEPGSDQGRLGDILDAAPPHGKHMGAIRHHLLNIQLSSKCCRTDGGRGMSREMCPTRVGCHVVVLCACVSFISLTPAVV